MAAISFRPSLALAAGACAIMALGVGCANTKEEFRGSDGETTVRAQDQTPTKGKNSEKPKETGTFTTFIAVEAFDARARAEQIVNGNQGKAAGSARYERITSGVVMDPENPTRAYFATSAYDAAARTDFVGVYGFDTKSLNWWRLYKNEYRQKNDVPPALLRVIALDGGKLFVVEDRVGASYPAGTVAKDVGRILEFDFAHPEEGLFPLPDVPERVANLPL